MPFTLAEDSRAKPLFDDLPDDDRWAYPGRALTLHPGETAEPIPFVRAWAPGRYPVSAQLGNHGPEWNTAMTVRFDDGAPLHPTLSERGHDGVLGEVSPGERFLLEIDSGGRRVALRARVLERLDGGEPGDPDLPEKLKKLGYQ